MHWFFRLTLLLFFCGTGWCAPAAKPRPLNGLPAYQAVFSQPRFAGLHTAAKEFYLSEEEKLVVALCNLVRYDPKGFIEEVLKPAGIDSTQPEYQEMFSVLSRQKSVLPLMPAFSLYKSAMSHARDMGFSGKSGHVSSDGRSFSQRIQQHFPSHTGFAENYYIGNGDPLEMVLSFLQAKGEHGAEYRKNLLSPNLHYIGISILPHRNSCNNAVLDFAQKPQVAASENRKKKEVDVYWRDCPTGSKVATRRKSGGFWFANLFGARRR